MRSIFASTKSSHAVDIISPGLRVGFIPLWYLQGNTVIGYLVQPFHKCSSSEEKEERVFVLCLLRLALCSDSKWYKHLWGTINATEIKCSLTVTWQMRRGLQRQVSTISEWLTPGAQLTFPGWAAGHNNDYCATVKVGMLQRQDTSKTKRDIKRKVEIPTMSCRFSAGRSVWAHKESTWQLRREVWNRRNSMQIKEKWGRRQGGSGAGGENKWHP